MTYGSCGDCAYCGGPTEHLGTLGYAHYLRCRSCGAENVEYTAPPDDERRKELDFDRGVERRAMRASMDVKDRPEWPQRG